MEHRSPARETSLTGSAALPLGRGRALVLALEPLHAPGGVHELLLAGVEGVTLRAHLHPDFRLGRARLDDFPARARNGRIDVVRMNASLHGPPPGRFENTSGGRKRQNGPGALHFRQHDSANTIDSEEADMSEPK